MPTVLNVSGFRSFFYSMEAQEPPHIHVESGSTTSKFWLEPVELARSRGLRSRELNRLRALVIRHRLESWRRRVAISALKFDSDAIDVETTNVALRVTLADGREWPRRWRGFPACGTQRPNSVDTGG